MGCVCVSQEGRGVKKAFGFWPKKIEKQKKKSEIFPVVFSLRFFLIAFLVVSLHEEPKNTIKIL
jgi:hypothetical protein